jgi:hypothetical protein
MLNEYSFCNDQFIYLQNRERMIQYGKAAAIYRMTRNLRENKVIRAAERFFANGRTGLKSIA